MPSSYDHARDRAAATSAKRIAASQRAVLATEAHIRSSRAMLDRTRRLLASTQGLAEPGFVILCSADLNATAAMASTDIRRVGEVKGRGWPSGISEDQWMAVRLRAGSH
ncbi:hypothetical protein ACFSCW_14880 [Sphingomonas tabacisoli]|uniref:Uncharacterized protein n=1 Tax=Sphingomonas tabacisoli TaxID=2249466 RepID=A0ABW4I553_9SPHN